MLLRNKNGLRPIELKRENQGLEVNSVEAWDYVSVQLTIAELWRLDRYLQLCLEPDAFLKWDAVTGIDFRHEEGCIEFWLQHDAICVTLSSKLDRETKKMVCYEIDKTMIGSLHDFVRETAVALSDDIESPQFGLSLEGSSQ